MQSIDFFFTAVIDALLSALSRVKSKIIKNRAFFRYENAVVLRTLPVFFILFLTACTDIKPATPLPPEYINFKTESKRSEHFTPAAQIETMSASLPTRYLLGAGDILELKVWRRPELSQPVIVVGPDGEISITRIGSINVTGRTREDVAREITKKFSVYYTKPEITLSIKAHKNNKAFVLGRVENPGVVTFPGQGTLLEALSMAGGLPIVAEQAFLTKCAIIRGKDTIIWVDLNELLQNGNVALNARIINNDVIFIPESQSELVYVMGEVFKPSTFRLTGQMTVMDALMMAGGPTKNANRKKLYLIRSTENDRGNIKEIDLLAMLNTADLSKNYLLHDNDILYVSEKGISKFNYNIQQIVPFFNVLNLTTDSLEKWGVMQKVRQGLWGQEGFVGD
ncbi:MAG: hypothetical protein B6I22_09745 [Desulfobacteraceae bacterium 4572_123]|nr:MAG: hypothetical protein B6I22_09745 [Desulfobacteraceae bacterium 4572_123]